MSMTCGQIFMLVIQNTDLHCNISKNNNNINYTQTNEKKVDHDIDPIIKVISR